MKLPRGFFSVLFLLLSTPVQVYFFGVLRAQVKKRVDNINYQRTLLWCSGCLFALPFMPLAWRIIFGLYGKQGYPFLLRGFLSASSIWWAGSIGCVAILLSYNCFRRFNLFLNREPAATTVDSGRRGFLRRSVGVAATAPFMLSGYGVLVGRHRFQLEHFDIPVSGLSSALSQLSIVQLTDIHVGPFMPPEELARYVEAVNRLQPDLIALTGDFITASRSEVVPCVETLAALKARYGVFACLGNHDTFAGAANKLTTALREKDIQVLRNDSIVVEVGNTRVALLGIDDLVVGQPDFGRAVSAAEQQPAEVNILLSHRPEIFPAAAKQGMDLVLSGHYHGGQIKLLPERGGLSIARLLTPYAEGLFQLPRSAGVMMENPKVGNLFVGRGVGITALPIRINCPPQIAQLTLKNI